MSKSLFLLFSLLPLFTTFAQFTTKDFVIKPSVSFSKIEDTIIVKFDFPAFPFYGNLSIHSKPIHSEHWLEVKEDNTDTLIPPNTAKEYSFFLDADTLGAYGYYIIGDCEDVKLTSGKVLVLVDTTIIDSIKSELEQFAWDLHADGWGVIIRSVPRSEDFNPIAVNKVKRLVWRYIHLGNEPLRAVVLIGRVPVPYTGNYTFDAHPDHIGAFPADIFYVCPDCKWTDSEEFANTSAREENYNFPFDGKFDQTSLTAPIYTAIGRIDFFGLSDFRETELELIKRYLQKNHNFRIGNFPFVRNALIDDGFGVVSPESYASNAWMNFYAISDTIDEGKLFENISQKYYHLSYACNSGSYTSIWQALNSRQCAENEINTTFLFLFGSYLWDWDSQRNLLRSTLGSVPNCLLSCWIGRPFWHFHYFITGEPFAFSFIRTANNQNFYRSTGMFGYRGAHLNIIGDPTLRMYYGKPPKIISFDSIFIDFKVYYKIKLDFVDQPEQIALFGSNSIEDTPTLIDETPAQSKEILIAKDKLDKFAFVHIRLLYKFQSKFGYFRKASLGVIQKLKN